MLEIRVDTYNRSRTLTGDLLLSTTHRHPHLVHNTKRRTERGSEITRKTLTKIANDDDVPANSRVRSWQHDLKNRMKYV